MQEQGDRIRRLAALAARGGLGAFGLLYDHFQPEVLRYLKEQVKDIETAEDVTQQIFAVAWQRAPRYPGSRTPFRAWLFRLADEVLADLRRARGTRPAVSAGAHSPEEHVEGSSSRWELPADVRAAIARLPDDQQRVLILRFWMGFSADEVAETLQLSFKDVCERQLIGLRALARALLESEVV